MTKEYALKKGKPCFVANLANDDVVASILAWIGGEQIHVLNIAGPRESQRPGIYEKAYAALDQVFTLLSQRAF